MASSMVLESKSVRELVNLIGLPAITGYGDRWVAGCREKISELLESIVPVEVGG